MTLSLDGRWRLHAEKENGGGGSVKKRQGEPAETKPVAGAAKALIRNMYVHGDVAEYVAGKYEIKGEIGIGQEGIGADKALP